VADSDSNDKSKPRTGRVRHDSGGRAIWEWAIESGKHAIDSTSRLLKKLDLTGITLVGDEARPWEKKSRSRDGSPTQAEGEAGHAGKSAGRSDAPSLVDTAKNRRDRGFNPYDNRLPAGRGKAEAKSAPPARPRVTQPTARKRGFLARLFGRR
jgi:hypothetical protein